jgi:hypothetical protein
MMITNKLFNSHTIQIAASAFVLNLVDSTTAITIEALNQPEDGISRNTLLAFCFAGAALAASTIFLCYRRVARRALSQGQPTSTQPHRPAVLPNWGWEQTNAKLVDAEFPRTFSTAKMCIKTLKFYKLPHALAICRNDVASIKLNSELIDISNTMLKNVARRWLELAPTMNANDVAKTVKFLADHRKHFPKEAVPSLMNTLEQRVSALTALHREEKIKLSEDDGHALAMSFQKAQKADIEEKMREEIRARSQPSSSTARPLSSSFVQKVG